MLDFFKNLDRRWVFLSMFLAVGLPILLQIRFPETSTPLTQSFFDAIDELPDGSPILLAFDYDPASEGELGPMATAVTRQCAEKNHKMYFMTIFHPVGPQLIDETITQVIKADFPDMVYGVDYVNLGYKPGYEAVIKVIVTNLKQLYTTDDKGTNIDQIPMCQEIESVQDFDLVVNISAGYPGTKEWVLFAATPYPEQIKVIAGCTGVQAPLLYPYIPDQLPGLLGAIKGAAEYENLVVEKYGLEDQPKYQEGLRRMGPQLVAHLLMIALIVAGNIIYFAERRREARR